MLLLHFDRYRRVGELDSASTKRGRRQEEELLNAALARDARTACSILSRHIEDSAKLIVALLQARWQSKPQRATRSS